MKAKKSYRYVKVFNNQHEELPRRGAKPDDVVVAVLVIDENNIVMHHSQWDIKTIAQQIQDARKRKASEVMLAREIANLGEEEGDAVNQLIRMKLSKIEKAKKRKR